MNERSSSPFAAMSKEQLIEALEKHHATLEAIYQTIHQPNARMSPGEKLLEIGARCLLPQEKPNEKGMVRMPTDKLETFTGMSDTSVLRYANSLIDRFGATKDLEDYITKKGQTRHLIYVNPHEAIWQRPWEADLPEEKERIINRNYCPHCKSSGTLRVQKRTTRTQEIHTCDCCGYKKITEESESTALPPMVYLPEKAPQPEEPFDPTREEEKAPQPEDLFLPEDQKSAPLTYPLTHTTPVFDAPEPEAKKALQPEDLLVTLLRERVGNVPHKLIKATGKMTAADKYISLPDSYVPDIGAYINGDPDHIYGSNLRNTDGTTYVLEFDYDTVDQALLKFDCLRMLANAGASPICWSRRPGRGHLSIRFGEPVDAQAAYAWAIKVCPLLASFKECYPVKGIEDKRNQRISWPFWYRDGDEVYECAADAHFPGMDLPVHSTGIKSDRERLVVMISQAVTPASIVSSLPEPEQQLALHDAPAAGLLSLLDTAPTRPGNYTGDIAKAAIAQFNASTSWQDIADVKNGRFLASWRGERTASVVIDRDGEYACDHGNHGAWPKKVDRFEAYCLINKLDKRAELRRLCDVYRAAQQGAA